MILSQKLTKEQRIETLNNNIEDIKMDIYFERGYRDEEKVKHIISTMIERMLEDNFLSNFLNSFEGVDTNDIINNVCDDMERLVSNSIDLGEINHERVRNFLPSSMR